MYTEQAMAHAHLRNALQQLDGCYPKDYAWLRRYRPDVAEAVRSAANHVEAALNLLDSATTLAA